MSNAETVKKIEALVGREDYDGAFDLADNLSEEPWRSSAFELIVGLFISPRFLDRFGVDAIKQAYLVAKNEILDPSMRAESFLLIANVASENKDWETAMKASRQAVFEYFYK